MAMDPSSLIVLMVAAVALIAASGAFTIAFRRSGVTQREEWPEPGPAPKTARTLGATPAPEATRQERTVPAQDQTGRAAERHPGSRPVSVVEIQRIVEVSPEESGVTRRQFFNRALAGSFGAFLTILGLDALAFFWPRLSGGFGTRVDAGPVEDIRAQLAPPVTPFVVNEAWAYVVPITPEQVGTSQFNEPGLVAGGLMAMWWRCVHLGCRTPWCAPAAGFECPCHGSKYNLLGEYQAGPAPRNLDRFVVEVTPDGASHHRHRHHRPDPAGAQGHCPLPAGTILYSHMTAVRLEKLTDTPNRRTWPTTSRAGAGC